MMNNIINIFFPSKRLENIVKRNAFLWGDSVRETYHEVAARAMDDQWNSLILPILKRHKIKYRTCLELSAGYGRNSKKLLSLLSEDGVIFLVDVNQENINYLDNHVVPLGNFKTVKNNGYDLRAIEKSSIDFIYSFDSMVHFDPKIIESYIAEFSRVMTSGSVAFIHHSNLTKFPESLFTQNPHWRNFMSADIFRSLVERNGLVLLEQVKIRWGGEDSGCMEDLDCITVFKKN